MADNGVPEGIPDEISAKYREFLNEFCSNRALEHEKEREQSRADAMAETDRLRDEIASLLGKDHEWLIRRFIDRVAEAYGVDAEYFYRCGFNDNMWLFTAPVKILSGRPLSVPEEPDADG